MPVFAYRAMDLQGSETAGTVTADNRATAVEQVMARGFTPIDVSEHHNKAGGAIPAKKVKPTGRLSFKYVEAFTREMANLLSAGIPLSRALNIVIREASNSQAKALWSAIHDDVVSGVAFADALAKWPRTFPSVYIAMVRAGELGGFLDVVLTQISDFQTREQDLKGKVKAALVYPAVLAMLALLVLIFLLTYFIPRFSVIFKEFGGQLPWLTQVIVMASDIVMKRGLIAAAVGGVIFVAVKRALKTESGKRLTEKAIIRTPLLGHVVAHFALVRFSRMLGTLIGSGVALIAALKVAREAIGNQIMADAVSFAIEEVQRGASLSKSLGCCGDLFPPSVVEMVAVAEETGRLDKELMRMSVTFEADLDRKLRMLVALAEPLLLFVMAAVIGTVVVGMLLPLFQLQDLVH